MIPAIPGASSASSSCRGCRRSRAVQVVTLLSCLAFTQGGSSPSSRLYLGGRPLLSSSSPSLSSAAFLRPLTGGRQGASSLRHKQGWPSSSSGKVLIRRGRQQGQVVCAADLGLAIYDLQIWAKEVVDNQLTHLTPVSGAILYGAGLLTSLSPCALSLVPLTMAYLTDDGADPEKNGATATLFFRASMFTVGLALSLSILGLSATLAGRLFGSVGGGAGTLLGAILPLSASLVAVLMGLNLLGLIRLNLPSFESSLPLDKLPPSAQAFLLGASSALIASPCSTPVLASILGFVATSQEPYLGVGLLFSYSLGYSTPLLLAGLVSGTVTSFIRSKGDEFSWVTPATAAVLISYGTYSGLNTLFPSSPL